jgi:hypothetical protein
MAQRKRMRPSRAVWVGALAVFCGGFTGCFNPEKDKKPLGPPPQAKGSTGLQTTTGVFDKNGQLIKTNPGGVNPNSPYGNGTAGTPGATGNITGTPGQYPPDYRPGGPNYSPTAGANPYNPGTINTPTRPTSATQFNSYPATSPMVPSVTPTGGSSQSQPGYGTGTTSPPNMTNYGPLSGGSSSSTGSPMSYSKNDPTPAPLSDPGPIPPAPPSAGLAPAVGPSSPANTPVPTMAAPLSPAGSGYGGYPNR